MNKSAVIANQESTDVKEPTHDMLQAYRSTPHPATKETTSTPSTYKDARIKDSQYKEQVKKYLYTCIYMAPKGRWVHAYLQYIGCSRKNYP